MNSANCSKFEYVSSARIDPNMAAIFPTSEAVNEALRGLATAAQNLPHTTPKRSRQPRKVTAVPGG